MMVDEAMNSGIEDAVSRAQRAWPSIQLPRRIVTRYFEERVPESAESPHGADVFLCCASLEHVPAALRALDERLERVAHAALSPRAALEAHKADIMQTVRVELLVRDAQAVPKLAQYRGRGPLDAWLRVVVLRRALNYAATVPRDTLVTDSFLEGVIGPPSQGAPDIAYLKATHRPEVMAALNSALQRLSPRELAVIRLHLFEDLSLDEIGKLYGVHRTTTFRWYERARTSVFDSVFKTLNETLSLTNSELMSLLRAVVSGIDLTVVSKGTPAP